MTNDEAREDNSAVEQPKSEVEPFVVGIGASAGGLEAFTILLSYLPENSGMAFILVQHLDPHHQSSLAEILSAQTAVPVIQVETGVELKVNRAYIIPPNTMMRVDGMKLVLEPRPAGPEGLHPIDVLFTSLAKAFGPRAIGVVLSGAATDGTLGLQRIKAQGGITFAQDQTAKFESMPRSAIAAGVVDFILPPKRIAEELLAISQPSLRDAGIGPEWFGDGTALQRLLTILRQQTGVDFTQYKQPTIIRRVTRRVTLRKAESVEAYLEIVNKEPAEAKALFDDLLINVTEFFRDPEVFDTAQNTAFRSLVGESKRPRTIRVWIPACSSGEEVYSMAIALMEFFEAQNLNWPIQIFGTDVSELAVNKARHGIYREDATGNLSPQRLQRFFVRNENVYQISRQIREMCIFSRHNVANDPPLSRMDLISCRNVLIYFSQTLQKRIVKTFAYALAPNGILILGSSEALGGLHEYFQTIDEQHKIYCRNSLRVPFSLEHAAPDFDYSINALIQSKSPLDPEFRSSIISSFAKREEALSEEDLSSRPPASLEQELVSTRDYLQSVIEELRSTNEEAQSANEELQSTNEELQTSKEELQSSNEELNTVNAEMQSRHTELAQANDDLTNLLGSMNMPIVMTGRDLRVRRFTAATERVLRLISTDVGRPITDLKPQIDIANLDDILRRVLDTLEPYEHEVRDADGRIYLLRVRPYRTLDNRIDGTVLQLLDVTDLKKSLEEAREARSYAEAIVNTVREPLIILSPTFNIENANRAFFHWLSVSSADTLGRSIFELARGQFDMPPVRHLLDQLIHSSSPVADVEIEYQTETTDRRNLLLNARRLSTSDQKLILMAFEDITERKRAAEARYRRLFESAWDGILLVDANSGDILDLNPFTERLFGYGRAELIGRKVWYAGPMRNLPTTRSTVEQIRDKGVIRFDELNLAAKDGHDIQAEVIANIYQEGERRVIQFNIRDVTERRRFERKLQETQKLEGLGLLAGGIAHDFNNLLTGIMGNASLAYMDIPPDHPARLNIREVIQAGERAAFLTRQMLAYAGKGRFVMETLDLGDLVREISTLVRTSIPKTVEVKLDLSPDLPPIEADPAQLQQVVMNLVINAAEAIGDNPAGKVEVRTSLRQLNQAEGEEFFGPGPTRSEAYLQLEVADNGSGMDEETKARIFDPFLYDKIHRVAALVWLLFRALSSRHGGALRVYSTPGHGTTFLILLVAHRRPVVQVAQNLRRTPDIPAGSVALIVDDEDVVRNLASEILARQGMKILVAENGQEGVDMFRQHHRLISIVILDLTMPVMSGEEALTQMKAIDANIPVILSSGFDESEAAQKFVTLKPAGFLQKPYTSDRLTRAVSVGLSRMG